MYVIKRINKNLPPAYLFRVTIFPANPDHSLVPALLVENLELDDDEFLDDVLDHVLVFQEKLDAYLFIASLGILGLDEYSYEVESIG